MTDEAVDHPAHYGGADNPYETIKVIRAWGLNFELGNAVKYISRAGKKSPDTALEDLRKARWYLEYEIGQREGYLYATGQPDAGAEEDCHMSLMRRGLDYLLSEFRDAELAQAVNQDADVRSVVGDAVPEPFPVFGYLLQAEPAQGPSPGPWTCVDLVVSGELRRFAIWNLTGAVYRVGEDGAVEDDPFLRP